MKNSTKTELQKKLDAYIKEKSLVINKSL